MQNKATKISRASKSVQVYFMMRFTNTPLYSIKILYK
jgi:hypothetical protein